MMVHFSFTLLLGGSAIVVLTYNIVVRAVLHWAEDQIAAQLFSWVRFPSAEDLIGLEFFSTTQGIEYHSTCPKCKTGRLAKKALSE